ncbi:transcriptional regulator MimR [Pseudonocardia tropica]
MMDRSPDRRLVLSSARVDLLERGTSPELHGVPEVVAASWKRCVSQGVGPESFSGGYSEEFDAASRLVHCAAPVLDRLAQQIADIPACVALSDDRARILSRIDGDPWISRLLDRVHFARGFGYAEGAVGTNGVGTVFESGRSVQIVGEEHFVASLQSFACAGAPVRDPFTGRIEGVLDISCLSDHSSPVFHSMVRVAAAQIEQNLLLDRDVVQQALFDRYTRTESRSRDAVLAVGTRSVLSNRAMSTLVSATDLQALEDHLRFLAERHDDVDALVTLPSGATVRIDGDRVVAGSTVAGMVVRARLVCDVDATPPPVRSGPAVTGASTSPSMQAAERTVSDALSRGAPLLLLGEPGSGRTRMLGRRFRRLYPDGEVVVVPRAEIESAPTTVGRRIRADAAVPRLWVLGDIDALSAASASVLARELHVRGGRTALAATAVDGTRAAGEENRLLRIFRRSATVTPLRHRTADLPGLVAEVLGDLVPQREVRVTAEAMRLLERYRWPGNVGQLVEVLGHALRRRPVGDIEPDDLPSVCQSVPREPLRRVDELERDAIVQALREHDGNRKAAALSLGLARSTLYRKIHQYGISV